MKSERVFFLVLLLSFYSLHAQSPRYKKFGEPTSHDFAINKYNPEPDSPGVILYESGNYYAKSVGIGIYLVKEVYRKIKVLNAKKFNYTDVTIPYYEGNGRYKEEVLEYEAITHNGPDQSHVPESAFFTVEKSNSKKSLKFTFPNVQDGSILEYKYTKLTPFFYDLDRWEFQHELPTIYSLFQTVMPVNFKYNRILYGDQHLVINNTALKENGFKLPNDKRVDSEVHLFSMENVPSFSEEEYMLGKKNYVSRIVYEPVSFKSFNVEWKKQVFTRNWNDIDKLFKEDEDFGDQLVQKNYFRRKLPKDILNIENELERAKAVYSFIQNEYTWNGQYFNYNENVKEAFKNKLGSVSAINLSLVNALEAAGLKAKPVLLSTRKNGLPTKVYPILSNFNYVISVLMINDEFILLDATNKQAPFGIIPYRALNIDGRVMDFNKGSYWMPIKPYNKNILFAHSKISAESNGHFKGVVNQANYGYIGFEKRNAIEEVTLQQYIKNQENKIAGIEVENFQIEELNNIEKPLKENYEVTVEPEVVGDKVILHPFFNKTYISKNPFNLDKRNYPIDFGFPFTNTYLVSIDLGEEYQVEHLPSSRSIKLQGDDGECSVTYIADGNKVNIRFNMKLNSYRFTPEAYQALKEFFGTMVTMLKDEPIILKKI